MNWEDFLRLTRFSYQSGVFPFVAFLLNLFNFRFLVFLLMHRVSCHQVLWKTAIAFRKQENIHFSQTAQCIYEYATHLVGRIVDNGVRSYRLLDMILKSMNYYRTQFVSILKLCWLTSQAHHNTAGNLAIQRE